LGLALILGAGFAAMLGSYSPDDPGWMVATDEPAQNMLGRFGAAVSSTLVILIGRGAWTVPLILFAWGMRFPASRRRTGAGPRGLCRDRRGAGLGAMRDAGAAGGLERMPSVWAGCSAIPCRGADRA
jgi:hypothetical protein